MSGPEMGCCSGWPEMECPVMPQIQLPVFPSGTTHITAELAFERRGDQVVYFNGHLPVFTHQVSDVASFRLFTTQLLINGTASNGDIVRAFGVPLRTLKRYRQRYRERGAKSFYEAAAKRKGSRLNGERLVEVQRLLEEGLSVAEVSRRSGVLGSTLHKAIGDGRLRHEKKREAGRARWRRGPEPRGARVNGA